MSLSFRTVLPSVSPIAALSSLPTCASPYCPRPATLVRRETALEGWSAAVGGRSLPIRTSDGLFQSVTVPAGSHRVTFSYVPPGIVWAGLAFLLGVLSLVFGPAASGKRRYFAR